MIWQPHESQRMIVLDDETARLLSRYLDNKEKILSAHLLESIALFEGNPLLEQTTTTSSIRLSDALEEWGRKMNRSRKEKINTTIGQQSWKIGLKQINHAIWSYIEVLEGSATELFQQIEQIGFEHWNVDLIAALTAMKDELKNRMDSLLWALRRFEEQLKNYQALEEAQMWKTVLKKPFNFFFPLLDRSFEPTITKCSKFLSFRFRKFFERYTGYLQLYESSQQAIQKFYSFKALSSLDFEQQEKVRELYFLLNLWKQNNQARVLQRTEPVRAFRNFMDTEEVLQLLKEYFLAVRSSVFNKSRLIKREFKLVFLEKQTKKTIQESIYQDLEELLAIKELILSFEKFYIQTNPQTYFWLSIFYKKLKYPHKKNLSQLQKLHLDVTNLEQVTINFQSSLNKELISENILNSGIEEEINKYLHEMGQPLASKDLMRRNAKGLMSSLNRLDEVSSFDPQVVNLITHTLCKAMCADWKYHVLQENPLFHQIYQNHLDICHQADEKPHLNRLHKFQMILHELEIWIQNKEMVKHLHEIDVDIHDIKSYLQDFLAQVQRIDNKNVNVEEEALERGKRFESPVDKAIYSLLQYLYLFGNFFAKLKANDPEHRLLRKQLLFIDQYFEAIDRRIRDLY